MGCVDLPNRPQKFFGRCTCIHHKRTSATFYERAPPVNIPDRSISGVTDTKMAKIAILEMADLAALQP